MSFLFPCQLDQSLRESIQRFPYQYLCFWSQHKPTSPARDEDTLRFRKLIKSPDFYIGLNLLLLEGERTIYWFFLCSSCLSICTLLLSRADWSISWTLHDGCAWVKLRIIEYKCILLDFLNTAHVDQESWLSQQWYCTPNPYPLGLGEQFQTTSWTLS